MPAILPQPRRSPLFIVLLIGTAILFILVIRGLDFGPVLAELHIRSTIGVVGALSGWFCPRRNLSA